MVNNEFSRYISSHKRGLFTNSTFGNNLMIIWWQKQISHHWPPPLSDMLVKMVECSVGCYLRWWGRQLAQRVARKGRSPWTWCWAGSSPCLPSPSAASGHCAVGCQGQRTSAGCSTHRWSHSLALQYTHNQYLSYYLNGGSQSGLLRLSLRFNKDVLPGSWWKGHACICPHPHYSVL